MEQNETEIDGTKNDLLAFTLAEGDTVQSAAENAGIGRTTAYRRLADPAKIRIRQSPRGGEDP